MIKEKSNSAPADLLKDVIEAVVEAGGMIRKEFHRPGGPRGEGGHAPIDEEVEDLLKRRLLGLHPCSWLGEETGELRTTSEDIWIVDPNDGTSDFLAGRRGSAVSVALVRNGEPVLGVVCAPVAPDDNGDLITWAKGSVLKRNGVVVSPVIAGPHPVVALNANAPDYALHNHRTMVGLRVRALPSPAYRLALAAVGEVDAAISLIWGLEQWDFAGGHALLIGAGRILVDQSGKNIDYRRSAINGCIGGSADLVEKIVAMKLGDGPRQRRRSAIPKVRVSEPEVLSRAQGCLLGQLAGDALGSAVEFLTAVKIAQTHPNGVKLLTDGGTWDLIAGQPTDDSEMALALARTLVEQGNFDGAAIGRAYVEWQRSGPFDIGATTSTGIEALARGQRASSKSQSNGALMRVSPVGIFAAGDPANAAQLGAKDALLTHPHPICQAASAAFAAAVAIGVHGGDAEAMWSAANEHAGATPESNLVRDALNAARASGPQDFYHQMGWVLTAFQNAFFHLMHGNKLADAVIATVAEGGDTDTNAAVCGALLGAAQGREAVPLQWRNAVLTCRPVQAADVENPRPQTYWPDDALDLAEALLVAGRD